MKGSVDTIRLCIENRVNLGMKTEGIPYSIFLLTLEAATNLYQDTLYDVLKMLVIPENIETMKDRLGQTIAHVAASFNMTSLLNSILRDFPALAEMVDLEGNSILFSACRSYATDGWSYAKK